MRFSKLESWAYLAGGIAHDFNNILTRHTWGCWPGDAGWQDRTQVQDRFAQAGKACLRAQALSQQLLTFAEGATPIKKSVSIAKLLKESPMLALSGSRSRYEVSIPDDLWSVEAD